MEIRDLKRYYYYEDLVSYGKRLSRSYPFLLDMERIGTSRDNREIFLLKAGKGPKHIILTAGVHGRETVNPVVLMAMLEEYCKNRPEVLDQYSLYTIPLLNPDGYMIALKGFSAITSERLRLAVKAKGVPARLWKFNAKAVDINRNFPSAAWVKKSPSDEPASEPETQALIRLFHDVESDCYIDYHSRGKSIYYYRGRMPEEYNRRQYRLAGRLCMLTNYMLVPRQDEIESGDSGGNTVHYYSETFQKPAFTIETVDEREGFPLHAALQEQTLPEILETPFLL